jgi:hypothetical protein
MSLEGIIKGTKKFIGTTILGLTLACSQGGNLIQTQQGCVTDTDCNADLGRYCNYDTGECEGGEVGDDEECNVDHELGCGTVYVQDFDIVPGESLDSSIYALDLATMQEEVIVDLPNSLTDIDNPLGSLVNKLSPDKNYALVGKHVFEMDTGRYMEISVPSNCVVSRENSWFPDGTFIYGVACSEGDVPSVRESLALYRKDISNGFVEEISAWHEELGTGISNLGVSDDGTWVAYEVSKWRDATLNQQRGYIQTINVDGSDRLELSSPHPLIDVYMCGQDIYYNLVPQTLADWEYFKSNQDGSDVELLFEGRYLSFTFNSTCTKAILWNEGDEGGYSLWNTSVTELDSDMFHYVPFEWRETL